MVTVDEREVEGGDGPYPLLDLHTPSERLVHQSWQCQRRGRALEMDDVGEARFPDDPDACVVEQGVLQRVYRDVPRAGVAGGEDRFAQEERGHPKTKSRLQGANRPLGDRKITDGFALCLGDAGWLERKLAIALTFDASGFEERPNVVP